jgi:putative transposase
MLYLILNQVLCYMNQENLAKHYADFITVTCLEWKHVLQEGRLKDVIVDSLFFLSDSKRVDIYAFVIMSNHFHLIWQVLGYHNREDIQRDFLKYTSRQILKVLRTNRLLFSRSY